MRRRKGDLPGRFVNAHLRRRPNRPSEYVDVAAYQESVEPPPAEHIILAPQGELDLIVTPKASEEAFAAEEENPR